MSSESAIDTVDSRFVTWLSAMAGATLVSLLGVFPVLVVPNADSRGEPMSCTEKNARVSLAFHGRNRCLEGRATLQLLLSVAVGSQLADVFLHLLPEAFAHPQASGIFIGLWTIAGFCLFYLIERIFTEQPNEQVK
jgi:solute carrier family 39 (zinc transporter), member 13